MGAALDPDLRSTLAAVPLERDVVLVRGPDALAYLQGQLSQDLDALAVGATVPALLLQPTGKLVAWLRVTRTADDALVLDLDAGAGDEARARLRRFLLRTDATVEATRWSGLAVRGPGAAAAVGAPPADGALVLPAGWPGVEGVDVLGPAGVDLGLPVASAAALEALRVECGVPASGAEITEATIPAELGQWVVDGAVSFTKGCYAGQELVARIDSRGGNVPRPVRGLRLADESGLVAGAAVLVEGQAVGALTSVAMSPALGAVALAPLARSVAPGQEATVDAGAGRTSRAVVSELPLR
jgi:folate-binding protein YgfZ